MKPLATSSERPPLLLRKTVLVCRGEDGGGEDGGSERRSEGARGSQRRWEVQRTTRGER